MATKRRKAPGKTKPLLRAPQRIGSLDASALVGELRDLHERAEDPYIEQMPANEELYGALLYAERHVSALAKAGEVQRRKAALKRVMLWEYIREQAELHQLRAIEAARAALVEWADLAPALAVGGPSAAYNKAKRLRAIPLTTDAPDGQLLRRTPEAVLKAEQQIAQQAAAQHRAEQAARRQHQLLVPIAQSLLDCRDELAHNSEVDYWLEEVEEVLPDCKTPNQMLSLRTYLDAAVREMQKQERLSAQPVANTDTALLALAAAVELLRGGR
ncbi:hypothetical protein [Streptomyces sp. NBC_00568]|uniref:hypothetical protein n=1 Tax=Streptomyces sp. NBC_00568 TaxID=2975779 RepID=UPI00225527A8|nr:hypothetical protein [Streptomyces sp. NBC_00568]MCX4993647.1 hypothetical protein [Streptomyces sp. NBC_00568]